MTTLICKPIGIECKIKSQNNRAAMVLRKKILDAKDEFLTNVIIIFIFFFTYPLK